MKGTKTFGMVLAVVAMIFVFASVASAQTYAGILDGQWFKIKLGVKGYRVATGTDTVLGKGSGSISAYLYFDYTGINGTGTYSIITCTQDDLNPSQYHVIVNSDAISTDDIYGQTYPEVWDFGGTPLVFDDGSGLFSAYPTFYTKISADGATLKNASISNVACSLYADLTDDDQGADYATGSCSISGPRALPPKVPQACLP